MTLNEPTPAEVEQEIVELLRIEEIGALAVVTPDGAPLAATMHFASDGLATYVHTFTYTRKYAALLNDNRVSYTLDHLPADGFAGRAALRAIQVNGTATRVTEPAEIDRAIQVSHEQFEWLKDADIYKSFRRTGGAGSQVFFRIDPVEALWNDNRVRIQWRTLVRFDADGKHVATLEPYKSQG
ncbi:pyridoxamine 5'-phosphate oxidase family protein [Nocardia sp. NBC_00508]|uniref:pyridoxamine 5'-phosphate oxidase family protein n=1 Tax=Nocardia sp. NBC_00508 TaxID=2975992 RepID=UPI002E8244F2|nr:pyridoxamine 5'-phosphate oxidase family protein [Nocardia sp. NBC_00508]WUD66698.1 pyridoxamine 5'-phosphate oxidase family protein [Nocardia sp. NBC_00508]